MNRGEILAIVGESGSGKSVTALSVLQLLSAKTVRYPQGEILFSPDGESIVNMLQLKENTLRNIRGNQVAMIFQEPMTSLNPVFCCGTQVLEAIQLHQKCNKTEAKKKTIALFEQVQLPQPNELFYRYPHQLSGGQKQRVMIAMAMSCNPSLLICDEPTTALDVTVQKNILFLLKELQQSTSMGIVFITHDLGVVSEIANRAIVMYKGNIVEEGSVDAIFKQPRHPYTKSLLACRPVLHPKGKRLPVIGDFMNADFSSPLPPTITASNEVPPGSLYSSLRTSDTVLMRVQDLSVWFPAKKNIFGNPIAYTKAVNEVSFDVFEGETLGLVGESGCGKTTLGRALLRLIKPSSGKILFKGTDLTSKKNTELIPFRKDIQIVFQDPYSSLNPRITIGDALGEPLKVHQIIRTATKRQDKVVELLEKVNMTAEHLGRYPHEFSGGQRQRIAIARALTLNPSFIVCDESVSALDVSVQAQVLNLLNDLKKEFRFTIVFISHDLSVVRYISDRIMVMNKGSIAEVGEAESIFHNPGSQYTKTLIRSIPGYL